MTQSSFRTKQWVGQSRRVLTPTEVVQGLVNAPGWQLAGDGADVCIRKVYHFDNFYQTMAFVNAVAMVAHRQDHHPALHVGYAQCEVQFNTHDVGGISGTDFECAAMVDAVLE